MRLLKIVGPTKDLCSPQVYWHVDLGEVGWAILLQALWQMMTALRFRRIYQL